VRLFFVLLLLANIGFFAWQYQTHGGVSEGDNVRENLQPTDPGVTPLTLLSERPALPSPPPVVAENTAEALPLTEQAEEKQLPAGLPGDSAEPGQTTEPAASAEETGTAPAGSASASLSPPVPQTAPAGHCFELGPTEDRAAITQAETTAQQAGARTNIRETTQAGAGGYWVRLPDYFSLTEARAKYRELQQQGVDDVAIVPLPDNRYFISLGVYRKKDTMQERRDQVIAKGVTPTVDDRSEDVKLYTLVFEYAVTDTAPLQALQRTLTKQAPQIVLQEVACQ
jgi:hypothetical protein